MSTALARDLAAISVGAYLGKLTLSERDKQMVGLIDKAQNDAYAEGRNDEREEMTRLLAWAYRKLMPYSFSKLEDALAMDEIKLLLMHSEPSADAALKDATKTQTAG